MRATMLAIGLVAMPAVAQQPPAADPTCIGVKVAVPPELGGWNDQQPVSSGVKPGDGATIQLGKAALVSLHPAKHLALSPAPEKPSEANGGTLALAVTQGGTYRVALGGGAWIDLVQGGKPVASIAHAHGPRCTAIRKMVDFKLAPGNYTIQLSGSESDSIAMLVVKVA